MASGPRGRARVGALVISICLIAVFAASLTSAPTTRPGAPISIGPAELRSASASLSDGDGPADGAPMSCGAVASGTSSCGARAPAIVGSITSGPVWSNLTTHVVPLPSPRIAEMTWDASDGYVLLYGGYLVESGHVFEIPDTWSYVNGTWTNLTALVAGNPSVPILPALAYDPWTSTVILFGGETYENANLSVTWTYHARVWTNITSDVGAPPSPRVQSIFIADLASHQMILYGGAYALPRAAQGNWSTATWLFTGTLWANITGSVGTSPPPLFEDAAAYDPAESGIVLEGTNFAGPPYVGDTYLFTAGTWHNLTPTEFGAPPILNYPAMVYDATTSSVLALGSQVLESDGAGRVDVPVEWQFSAGNWTNITPSGFIPADGSGAAVATEPSGAILMFGGIYGPQFFSQWMYAYSSGPSAAQVSATPSTLDVNVVETVSATYGGGLAPVQTNLTFGDGTFVSDSTSATHAYDTPGTYPVTFNVTDLVGRTAQATATVTVYAAPSGLEIHAGPSSPNVGTSVNFSSSVVGGTPPFTSSWNFGDGTTATSTAVNHSFVTAGTFTVRLTVTDADGRTANASLAVTVASSPSSTALNPALEEYAIVGLILLVAVVVAAIVLYRRKQRPSQTVSAMPPSGPSEGGPPTIPPSTGGPPPPG
jgi:PKD repeat protein